MSVNVHRQEGETAEEARSNVVSLIESGGALSVTKRAHADILVVDTTSQFYKTTVTAEKEKFGRDWQRLAERDWVEACVRDERLNWRSGGGGGGEEDGDEDSFEDEQERVNIGKGPGRPTGK